MATKFTAGTVINAGLIVVGVDADAPPATPSPAPEPAPESAPEPITINNSRLVSLLLDASVDADGSVVDSSTNSHPITVNGDVSQSSFSPYRSGGYSWEFDGNGDQLTFSHAGFGTGDFTVGGWVFPENQVNRFPLCFEFGSLISVQYDREDIPGKFIVGGLQAADNNPSGQWYHIAAVRASGTLTLYVNGVAADSKTYTDNLSAHTAFIGGSSGVSSELAFKGKMSDVRFTNAAVYTENFSVPTERLTEVAGTSLLTCNLPYLQSGLTAHGDASPVAAGPYDYAGYSESLHGGSYAFDGSGDYLSVDLGDNLIDSNTPFTLEFWMYPENISNRGILHFTNNPGTLETILYISGAGNLSWFDSRVGSAAAGDITPNSGGGITTNEWHHIALTRQSDNYVRIYVDGQLYNTSFNVWDLGLSRYLEVGRYANTAYFDGYVSDIRIIEGTAVYTEDFTPPTAPLEAVTGTSLLLSGNNAAIRDESQTTEKLTVHGSIPSSDSSPYGSGKSMDFSGSYITSSDGIDFSDNDFTIELWWYPTDTGRQGLFHGSYGADWSIGIDYNSTYNNPTLGFWASSNGSSWDIANSDPGGNGITTGSPTQNAWNHIAYVRNGSTLTMYLNGVNVGEVTGVTAPIHSKTNTHQQSIGTWWKATGWGGGPMSGNVADYRISLEAVYTENFSVPTAPLGDYSESTPEPAPEPAPAAPAELVGEPSVSSFSHIPSTRYATPGSPAVTDAATGVDVGRPDTGSSASAMIDVTVEVGVEYEFSFTATTQSGDTMFMGVILSQGATTPEFGYVSDNALGQYPNTVHNRASVSGSGDSQTIVFTATQTDLQIVMWNNYSENLVNVQFISLKATS